MLMSVNVSLYSLLSLLFLITGCISLESQRTLKLDEPSLGGMVLGSINDWQKMRGIGVTEGVKKTILNEYISSMMECRTRPQSIDKTSIDFYIFQYLDYIREGGPYATEFLCNPFAGNIKRSQNRYGILQIEFDKGTGVLINNEQFNIAFNPFILTLGQYVIHIQSDGKNTCQRSAKIESGRISQISCKSLTG